MRTSPNIKSILVGVDFSDYSNLVVREAKQLATDLKLPLSFVYTYENVNLYQDGVILDRARVSEIFEEKVKNQYGVDDKQKIFIKFGLAEKEILNVAHKMKNPLILVGHKGGHRIARFFIGSVAEKLAITTPYPLWIHRGEKVLRPKKILVPSDLTSRSEKTIGALKAIKGPLESDLEIYHVLNEPMPILDYQAWSAVEIALRDADDRKIKSFKKKHPALKVVRSRGGVAESIYQHSKKFDLIAIAPRSDLKNSFGRVTSKVVRTGNTPVLVIP